MSVCTRCLLVVVAALVWASSPVIAAPIDGSFVYQGVVEDGGSPADGTYDFRYRLFNDAGVAVSTLLQFNGLVITDGLVNQTLPWSAAHYDGEKRFLEISLRASGDPSFTTLSPRTEIRPTPFASHAIEAETSLDNEWSRNADRISAGDTNDSILLNPDLSGGAVVNTNTMMQLNFDRSGWGGLWMNSVNSGGNPFYGFSQDGSISGYIEHNPDTDKMNFWAGLRQLSIGGNQVLVDYDLVVGDDVQVDGVVTKDFGTNQFHHVSPTAYGVFRMDGGRESGTPNISAEWDGQNSWYELTIAGESFVYTRDSAFVTPLGSSPLIATTGSFAGKLYVYLTNLSGNRVQAFFQVIVYDNEPVAGQ